MKLIEFIFPTKCEVCSSPTHEGSRILCRKCASEWESEKLKCRIANRGLSVRNYTDNVSENAGAALHLVYYDTSRTDSMANRLIIKLKYGRDKATVKFFARELASLILDGEIPCGDDIQLTWVPRGYQNIIKYGRDHMRAVSYELAKLLGVERIRVLRRKLNSKEQKYLNSKERHLNAKSSIVLKRGVSLEGKSVVLVDDIITTGASMSACAELIMKAGAKSVIGVAIGASIRSDNNFSGNS